MAIYQRKLQVLATELYKIKMGFAPLIGPELFPRSLSVYNLRFNYEFDLENKKTAWFGTESLSLLG